MQMDLISIIIPVYNVADYVEKCILSVLGQTYKNIEIILVDDGSTDASVTICDLYASNKENIIAVHQKNKGVSEARKSGLKKASGNFIAFIDADDWVEKDYIEELYKAITQSKADMASCAYYEDYRDTSKLIKNGSKSIRLYSGKAAIKAVNERKDIYPFLWNKLFTKESLSGLKDSVPVIIGEDYTIVIKALERMKKIVSINKPLYHYIKRESGVCNRGFSEEMFEVVNNYKNIYHSFNKESRKLQKAVFNYILLEEMYYVICMEKNHHYNHQFIRMVKKDLRKGLLGYLSGANIGLMQKCCAVAGAVSYRFMILGYKCSKHKETYYA